MRRRTTARLLATIVVLAATGTIPAAADTTCGGHDLTGITGTNPTTSEVWTAVQDESAHSGVPAEVLLAIGQLESSLRQYTSDGSPLVSQDGGVGMFQHTNPAACPNEATARRIASDWTYGLELAADKLATDAAYLSSTNPDELGPDTPDHYEGWSYVIRYYNGYRHTHLDYLYRYEQLIEAPPSRLQPYLPAADLSMPWEVIDDFYDRYPNVAILADPDRYVELVNGQPGPAHPTAFADIPSRRTDDGAPSNDTPPVASDPPTTPAVRESGRLAGPTRVETAAAIGRHVFGGAADIVTIVPAGPAEGALLAAAAITDGPVLLSDPQQASPATVQSIQQLGAHTIRLVAPTGTFSQPAQAQLANGRDIVHVAGDTWVEVAANLAIHATQASRCVAVTGPALVDGIVGGVIGCPLLLVPDPSGPAPAAVRSAVTAIDPATIMVLGGQAAVSDRLAADIAGERPLSRIAGPDRYATAAQIAQTAFPNGAPTVYLARADVFADSAAGGAVVDGPILLTGGPDVQALPTATVETLATLSPTRVLALGGELAVTDGQLAHAAAVQ